MMIFAASYKKSSRQKALKETKIKLTTLARQAYI